MTAFNFKAQFAADIESGKKRSTIRAHGKRRPPNVGEMLHLYTGMRTRGCRLLGRHVCLSVEPISINVADKSILVIRGGRWIVLHNYDYEVIDLAHSDGFQSTHDFFEFFGQSGNRLFTGFICKW